MSTSVTFNGTSYTVPAIADASWGTNVSNYLIAIATGCLQKTGGSFTLSAADVDFGGTYGLKSVYFKSKTANIASAGVVQLAKTDVISWRNNANGADLSLGITAGDVLTFNSIPFLYLALGSAYTVLQMNSGATAYVWATPTGTGAPALATSPTFVTPTLGAATATSINKMAITAPATSSTLAVADGKTATFSNTLTFAGTDGKTMTFSNSLTFTGTDGNSFAFPSGSSTVMTLASADTITGIKSFNDGKLALNGSSSGTMTVKAPAAASTFVATFFAATDTVMGLTFQQTATNKLFSDSTVKFGNVSDATKLLLFSLGGATTAKTMTLISSHTNDRSITFPDTTDTLVGKATTDALTNKDFQGGTASDASRITLPKASTSTLSGLTRKQATIVYDSTLNQVFSDDGSNLNPIGSGAGEKNYVSTGSSNAGGWTASDAGITVATDTTAADLPRALTSKSGILLSRVSGSTAYGYYRFTLDAADYNTKLKIAFAMKPGGSYVTSDFKVDVYSNTASNYSGTSTRLVLSTDSSAVSALPNATISYQTTFDSSGSAAPYMELRIGLNASTSGTTLAISDVIVGPGIKPQGAAISPTVTYTPTFSAGFGTVSATTVYYTRRADCVGIIGTTTAGTVAGSAATMTLPNSWTALATQVCGRWIRVNSTGTTRKAGTLFSTASSNTIGFGSDDYTTAAGPTTSANGSALFSNSDVIYVEILDLPIADLIGSGTVNVVQNDVEYVFNTSGTTSAGGSDTTSFGYGPVGAAIGNIASTTPSGSSHTGMRVRFNTPIQITDKLELETDEGTSGARWVSFSASAIPFINQGVAYYGAYLSIVNATDVDVFFGNGGATTGTTYAANGSTTWTNITTWRWRVKKFAGGQAIGFANVAQSTSGLVKSAGQLLGTNTNDTAASGFVGELITGQILRANRAGISNTSATNITSISLTTGDWDVWGTVGVQGGSGTTMSQIIGWVGSVTAALPSEISAGVTYLSGTSAGIASADDFIIPIASIPVSVNATTTYYLGVRAAFAVSTLSAYGTIYARRRR